MDLNEGEHEGGLMAKCKNCGAEKSRDSRKERCYKCEAKEAKKKIKDRAYLRKRRVEEGITGKDGMANGNGNTHIAHRKPRSKGGGNTKANTFKQAASINRTDQPKRKKPTKTA